MERLIDNLIGRYEMGALSRRDLVGALAVLGATGTGAWAAPAGFQSSTLNHVSITVSDLQRSVEFYQRVFGLALQSENKAAELVQLKLGASHLSIRRADGPKGVDHFAIGLDRFNKDSVIADLKARDATPREDPGAGLHVVDPDGLNVQLIANTAG
ncbi:MAG TPA: VOC family protein [Micropepsaceae bacterium]|jgi:catechol 2,3-dioxygenase-like lactoylglutathione lyase family enzyme